MKTLFKLRLFAYSIFLIFALIMATVPNASALTITRNFTGGSAPTNTAGGGSLVNIFNAAADWWEQAILDNHTVVIDFSWTDIDGFSLAYEYTDAQGGNPNRETQSRIKFDGDESSVWFMDSTPLTNEEYQTYTESYEDLGGGVLTTGRVYSDPTGSAIGRFDMLTVAMHEIGHALGLSSSNTSFKAETDDSDIDVTAAISAAFEGTVIPTNHGPHLETPGGAHPVMWAYIPTGERRILSAVDILANAQISGFTNINLDPHAPIPEPSTIVLLRIGLAGVAARRKWKKKAVEQS